jgi:hypothetical protein
MPVQRISFSNCLVNFFLKIALTTVLVPLSNFSALHNFQATAIEAGIGALERRVPPAVRAITQGTDPDHKSPISVGWHVA